MDLKADNIFRKQIIKFLKKSNSTAVPVSYFSTIFAFEFYSDRRFKIFSINKTQSSSSNQAIGVF